MGEGLAKGEIQVFVKKLSEAYKEPVALYLLGGSALSFLGSPRRTIDIDCTIDIQSQALEETIEKTALELKLEVEIVPIGEFIPLPEGNQDRHYRIEQFGSVEVFIFDPYSIALSKVARGFETDIQDVLFLLERNIIDLDRLAAFVKSTVPVAWDYDIDPAEMQKYLNIVRKRFHHS